MLTLPAAASYLRVELFNSLGERRMLLHEGGITAGEHRFPIGDGLPSGSYVIRMSDGDGTIRNTWFQVVR